MQRRCHVITQMGLPPLLLSPSSISQCSSWMPCDTERPCDNREWKIMGSSSWAVKSKALTLSYHQEIVGPKSQNCHSYGRAHIIGLAFQLGMIRLDITLLICKTLAICRCLWAHVCVSRQLMLSTRAVLWWHMSSSISCLRGSTC